MMARKMKFNVIAMAILLITGFAKESIAFPVAAIDMSQIGQSLQVVSNQIQEIKTQVETNINMVREGINGGFGMAVGDLFGNLGLDGTFDRFGNTLKNAKSSIQGAVSQVQGGISQFNLDKENRLSSLAKETARETASFLQGQKEALQEAKNIEKAARQAAEVQNTYNFLKDNHPVSNVVNQVKNKVETGISNTTSDVKDTINQQKNTFVSDVSKGVKNFVGQGNDEDSLGTNEGGSSTEADSGDETAEGTTDGSSATLEGKKNNNWRGLGKVQNVTLNKGITGNSTTTLKANTFQGLRGVGLGARNSQSAEKSK